MKINEVVYYCLDSIKALNDDSYVNEDHILFLLGKYRGALLQQYHNIKKIVPDSNYQTICLNLKPTDTIACLHGPILRSVEEIPDTIPIGQTTVLMSNGMENERIVFTSFSRLKSVGYNKWRGNFSYVAIGPDKHLYLSSNNPQAGYLSSVKLKGIFEDFETASKLSCDKDECKDTMELDFPLEVSLIPDLIARVVKDVLGVAWRPKDSSNDAADTLSDISTFIRQHMKKSYNQTLTDDDMV